MYETTDIHLAAYLQLKGEKLGIKEHRGQKIFFFNDGVSNLVDQFYEDEELFLSYANLLRNIKSRLINSRKELNNG